MCDFSADCVDGSDEAKCGPCDFETGWCGWSDISTGRYNWTVAVAKTSGTSPNNDHTTRSGNCSFKLTMLCDDLFHSLFLISCLIQSQAMARMPLWKEHGVNFSQMPNSNHPPYLLVVLAASCHFGIISMDCGLDHSHSPHR